MTEREKAILWLSSFVKNKEPMTLIPKQLIRLMYEALTEQPEIVRCKDCKRIGCQENGGEAGMIWDEDNQEAVGIERTNKYGISTITYVQLVRCKDCKRRGTYNCPVYVGGDGMYSVQDDWFCADGERRDL